MGGRSRQQSYGSFHRPWRCGVADQEEHPELAHVVGAPVARALEGVPGAQRVAQRALDEPELQRVRVRRQSVARLRRLPVGRQLQPVLTQIIPPRYES